MTDRAVGFGTLPDHSARRPRPQANGLRCLLLATVVGDELVGCGLERRGDVEGIEDSQVVTGEQPSELSVPASDQTVQD